MLMLLLLKNEKKGKMYCFTTRFLLVATFVYKFNSRSSVIIRMEYGGGSEDDDHDRTPYKVVTVFHCACFLVEYYVPPVLATLHNNQVMHTTHKAGSNPFLLIFLSVFHFPCVCHRHITTFSTDCCCTRCRFQSFACWWVSDSAGGDDDEDADYSVEAFLSGASTFFPFIFSLFQIKSWKT